MAFFVPLVLGRVGDRAPGGLLLVAGLALSGTGLLLMSHLSAGSGWTALLAGLVVAGVGIGVANPAIGRLALGVVAPQRSGMASGISNTFRIAGLTTGVAALGALFQHRLGASLGQQLGHASPGLTTQVASEGVACRLKNRAAGPRPLGGLCDRDERDPLRRRFGRARRGGAGADHGRHS